MTAGSRGASLAPQKDRHRWLGIQLRHFTALTAVAEERSFGRAAQRLGYVQSAVSRQIAQLERLTGARLIERSQGPKPVGLTEAGETLLAYASGILASTEAAQVELGELAERRSREVRVGLFAGVPARILAPTLMSYGRQHQGVRIAATETVIDAPLFDLLLDGGIDLAFVQLPPEPGPFAACELLRVPWVLVVPAGAEIARPHSQPSPMEIARLPLIGSRSERADPWPGSRLSAEAGEPNITIRCDGAQTAQVLVARGLGAALIPRLAVDPNDARTTAIELGDLLSPARIGLAWLRHRRESPDVVQFRETVRRVCAEIERIEPLTPRFGHDGASNGSAVASTLP